MSSKPEAETLNFQTEVTQLLHLVTHALYSNKEIFLRELISNSSDAADKLRFEALSDSALYGDDSELKIWIDTDEKAKTIIIRDNGVGMNREEVIANLGTIAKSGTREFLENLSGDQSKDANLIGQFGVGFYSAFVVADKVTVRTRRAGMTADQGVLWESTAQDNYKIENVELPTRGTEVTLHVRDEDKEFLDAHRLRSIVSKYSDHILLPIMMKQIEIPAAEGEEEVKDKTPEYEVVNRATALWTMPKSKIKEEEYQELYKHIAHDFENPLTWAHNRVEGKLDYTSLLYIPGRAPFDLWNRDVQHGLKLYVQRVFIMDDAEQLLPMYLRFVRGIVDSSDLPLNISREILQSNKTIEGIRSGCIKRVLGMLEKLATNDKEAYAKFWSEFGRVLKEGPAEDFANRASIAKLLRFASTKDESEEQRVSLDDYLGRMREDQDKIYYIIGDTLAAAKNSPHLEIFNKKGIEVLLLHDRVDEWLVAHLQDYQGKQLQSVAKGSLDLGELDDKQDEEEQKQVETEFESIIKQMQEVLGERVKEVRLTHRLTDSPACLVSDEDEMSMHLQRIMQEAGQEAMANQPIMEVNPEHPLIKRLQTEQDDKRFGAWSQMLFDQAFIAEGGKLDDPGSFVKRLNALLIELS